MNTDEEKINSITEAIIGCAFRVHNVLGCGFAEKVYENALAHELCKAGLSIQQQIPITVRYDGVVVGDYVADLIVEGMVLVELKAVKTFDENHMAQCLNYLAATALPICLLLNFGRKVEVKRLRGGY
jgi:GxxExxY protein